MRDMEYIRGYELKKKGGMWLAASRNFLQSNVYNGEYLTWGSGDKVTLTVKEVEEMAAHIAAAAINEYVYNNR